MSTPTGKDKVQGEGDYDAARRYDKSAREFAESGKVEPAARDAAPGSAAEAKELERAEAEGKSHSKGEGPLDSKNRKAWRPATALAARARGGAARRGHERRHPH